MTQLIFFTFVYLTTAIAASFIGLSWAGILLKDGNLFDWLVPHIRKIRNRQIKNLIQCHKCVSAQFGLWTSVILCIGYGYSPSLADIALFLTWLSFIIVFTDWAYVALKLDLKPAVPLPNTAAKITDSPKEPTCPPDGGECIKAS